MFELNSSSHTISKKLLSIVISTLITALGIGATVSTPAQAGVAPTSGMMETTGVADAASFNDSNYNVYQMASDGTYAYVISRTYNGQNYVPQVRKVNIETGVMDPTPFFTFPTTQYGTQPTSMFRAPDGSKFFFITTSTTFKKSLCQLKVSTMSFGCAELTADFGGMNGLSSPFVSTMKIDNPRAALAFDNTTAYVAGYISQPSAPGSQTYYRAVVMKVPLGDSLGTPVPLAVQGMFNFSGIALNGSRLVVTAATKSNFYTSPDWLALIDTTNGNVIDASAFGAPSLMYPSFVRSIGNKFFVVNQGDPYATPPIPGFVSIYQAPDPESGTFATDGLTYLSRVSFNATDAKRNSTNVELSPDNKYLYVLGTVGAYPYDGSESGAAGAIVIDTDNRSLAGTVPIFSDSRTGFDYWAEANSLAFNSAGTKALAGGFVNPKGGLAVTPTKALRILTPDTHLSGISVKNADTSANIPLTPTFSGSTATYSNTTSLIAAGAAVPVTVTPSFDGPAGTGQSQITVNGSVVASGTASESISLPLGLNTITVVRTGWDGVATRTYTVKIQVGPAGPNAPTGVTASAASGGAAISWTASSTSGGAPSATSYEVTSSPGGKTCTANAPAVTCTVTGLSDDTVYTFTVTASDGTNKSAASSPSSGYIHQSSNVQVQGGSESAVVQWPTVSNATSYTVESQPGDFKCTVASPAVSSSQSCEVTGLTDGVQYTFIVTATTPSTSADLKPSSAITPGTIVPIVPTKTPSTGSAIVTEGNAAPTPTVEAIPSATSISISGADWTLKLHATTESGQPQKLDAVGTLTVENSGKAHTEGTGFKINSSIKVYIFSVPLTLGTLTTDGSGNFTGSVNIPKTLTAGYHTIQVSGFTSSGKLRTISIRVKVVNASSSSSGSTSSKCNATLGQVLFGPDSTRLSTVAKTKLSAYAKTVARNKCTVVQVNGYAAKTNSAGNSERHRVAISSKRATVVATYLQSQFKTLKVKVTVRVKSFGSKGSVASNSSQAGRSANRRVVVIMQSVSAR